MKALITILVIIVAVVGSFWAYRHYGLGLNIKGFPLKPKPNDVFVKDGKSYIYINGSWSAFDPNTGGEIQRTKSNSSNDIAALKKEYENTFTESSNLNSSRLKRAQINLKLAKYGIELTPFNDKEGLKEIKVPKNFSIDNIFSREKNDGCQTQYCCNGSGLWWCRSYVCVDSEKGCRGCGGSCTNCNCTS